MVDIRRRDEYQEYGPYGFDGDSVGSRAVGVLAGLSGDVPESLVASDGRLVVLSEDDFQVFENLEQLESNIKFIEPGEDVDGGEIGDLHRTFARFHAALPLSEVERHWLFDPVDVAQARERAWDIHEPESLLGVAEEVVSGGVRQVIQGREVVRRLAAWRREADEFTHQGTLDEAREALGVMAITLVKGENWPREHLDIRTQLLEGEQGPS